MRFLLSAAGLAALIAIAGGIDAQAQSLAERAGGTFETRGDYWQRVKITPARGNQFRGAFEVATRGCQGDVEMRGVASGPDTILFSKRDESLDGGACKINVTFSRGFDTITVKHAYCGYSGPACDFNGVLRRTGR